MSNEVPVLTTDSVQVYLGDCLEVLKEFPDNSVDSVVTDPPYGLSKTDSGHVTESLKNWVGGDRSFVPHKRGGFMSMEWDNFVPPPAVWDEVFRVLKPGGHALVFAGARTHDLMGISCRLAGFEVRDEIAWIYGQGFPKNQDISKAIDKAAGVTRTEVIGIKPGHENFTGRDGYKSVKSDGGALSGDGGFARPWMEDPEKSEAYHHKFAPATSEAERWDGWGTALKPAIEPILLLRKPLSEKTVAANVIKHGTGGLNIDDSRIRITSGESLGGGVEKEARADQKGADGWTRPWMDNPEAQSAHAATVRGNVEKAEALGRFPANVMLSHTEECVRIGEGRATAAYRPEKQAVNSPPGTVLQESVDGFLNSQMSRAYGDPDGTEPVEVWECTPECSVSELNTQSGTGKSMRSNRGVGLTGSDVYGSGDLEYDTVRGYNDSDGASRFFKTFDPSRAGEASAERRYTDEGGTNFSPLPGPRGGAPEGRFPANVVLDAEAAETLDEQTGVLTSGKMMPTHTVAGTEREVYGKDVDGGYVTMETYGDSGGASRFFKVVGPRFKYTPKAPKKERPVVMIPARRIWRLHPELSDEARAWLDGQLAEPPAVTIADDWEADEGAVPEELHPYLVLHEIPGRKIVHSTVKPLELMKYLITLVTPPDGVVLDPFAGSGTTLQAAADLGFSSIGVERDDDYILLIAARLGLDEGEY